MVLVRNETGEDRMVAGQTPALWPADESRELTGDEAKSLLEQPGWRRTDRGRGNKPDAEEQS